MSTAEAYPPERDPAKGLPEALEARLASLADTVARLEARVGALESTRPFPKVPLEAVLGTPQDEGAVLPNPVRIMGLIGRVCLIQLVCDRLPDAFRGVT